MKKLLLFVLIVLLALTAVLVANTRRAPRPPGSKAQALAPMPDSAVKHLQESLTYPTISWGDDKPVDTLAFRGFGAFIERAYPLVHQKLQRQVFNEFSYMYTWKGKDSTAKPFILMGHYDVVPVEAEAEDMWRQKPFSGALVGDTVWGRGACDDKGSVIAILESVEQLLRSGFQPRQNIYLCFGHDEEIGGNRGARIMADWMKAKGIEAAFVLDEGGKYSTDPKISWQPLAVIGIQEKGYASYLLEVEIPGGHSSMPAKETAIDILAKGLTKLREQPTPDRMVPATNEFLHAPAGTSSSFATRMAVYNQWLLGGMLRSQLAKDKQTNAMIRTAQVPTMLDAGVKDNVIPTVARAVVNSRILPGETPESVKAYMKKTMDDKRISILPYDKNWWAPTNQTDTRGKAFALVSGAAGKVLDNTVTAPYMVVGATDSRYFRAVSTEVMNFVASTFMEGYHGIDERLPVSDYQRMINFVRHVIADAQ